MFRRIFATLLDLCLLPFAGCLLLKAWWSKSRSTENGTGILLLHGSGFNQQEWIVGRFLLWWWLPSHFHVFSMDYAGLISNEFHDGIDTYAHGPVRKHLLDLASQTGIQKWILVGHSMGGIIAGFYAEEFNQHDIPLVISIASPWQGSSLLEKLSPPLPRRYQQMLPKSPFLDQLGQAIATGKRRYVAYGSEHDLMVSGKSWCLASADNRCYNGLGHYAIIAWPPLWYDLAKVIQQTP